MCTLQYKTQNDDQSRKYTIYIYMYIEFISHNPDKELHVYWESFTVPWYMEWPYSF